MKQYSVIIVSAIPGNKYFVETKHKYFSNQENAFRYFDIQSIHESNFYGSVTDNNTGDLIAEFFND